MELPVQFDNINRRVVDDLKEKLTAASKVSVAAASFSIYAYEVLKKDLETLNLLLVMSQDITPGHDGKLTQLKADLQEKFMHPINGNIKKVLIFTTFSDTAVWCIKKKVRFSTHLLDLDKVWANIVTDISDFSLQGENTLKTQIKQNEVQAKLQKQMDALEKKCRAERQPRRKQELFEELKQLKQAYHGEV